MDKSTFSHILEAEAETFNNAVSTPSGDWIVKGFIDIARNIYTISMDTKVISKIMELLLLPRILNFARRHSLSVVLAEHQNHYPDITFLDKDANRFALDLKSTYRRSANTVNGMTLGTFTGYFRDREGTKNITFPYGSYDGHFVLGVIYTKVEDVVDESRIYSLDDLTSIASVVKDFAFFVQEKYKIASDRPGSGNTRNIGSVTNIGDLVNGIGPFSRLGVDVFDDYWMFYLNNEMARNAELKAPPYRNLESYFEYRGLNHDTT